MPTGYTAALHDGQDQSFTEFAMDCARAFGALVTLRDSPRTEIPTRFEPSSYHREAMEQAEADLRYWQEITDADLRAELRQAQEKVAEARRGIEASAREMEARYRAMLSKASDWTPPSPKHEGLRTFMIDQLTESIRFDCSTHPPPSPPSDPDSWQASRIAKAQRDIAYHSEQYAAECERAAERTAWVQALVASLESDGGES